MVVIDCKSIADKILDEVKERRERLLFTPALVTIYFQKSVFTKSLRETFEKAGLYLYKEFFDGSSAELEAKLRKCNEMPVYHGVLIQTPLSRSASRDVFESIDPEKDVDGATIENQVRYIVGNEVIAPPATPQAIVEVLTSLPGYSLRALQDKIITVVGKGNVGATLAARLMHISPNVHVCHTRTRNPVELIKRADIVISATGAIGIITEDKIKPGAVVIDVGYSTNVSPGSTAYRGDVDFEEVAHKASYITRVPGGVGLVTNAILARNLLRICERKNVY